MNSFLDVYNKLIEEKILSPEQFENVDENGFIVHLDDEYTIRVYPDEINLDRITDKKWKNRSTHTHQDMFDGNVYEATYEIVKDFSQDYKEIFKTRFIYHGIIYAVLYAVFMLLYYIYYRLTNK